MSCSNFIMVSVPGKIHLIGEHTVVYNRPAIIAAIDKRCFVSIKPRNDQKIEIISKNYDSASSMSISKLGEKTENARKSWKKFIKTKDVHNLTSITREPLDYPFLVVGETFKHYSVSLKNGFSLNIDSRIPVGSGCGSSSAIAVAIASVITLFLQKPLNKDTILKIAIQAEEFKHGVPSGGDPAAVLYGGLLWFQKVSLNERIIKPILAKAEEKIASHFYLIDTGKPEESTGEMIAIVRELKKKDSEEITKIFDRQENLTNTLLDILQTTDTDSVIDSMKSAEKNLEELGVVSAYVVDIIHAIEKSGGAAKISGGGGKTKGAGMILVYHQDKEKLQTTLNGYNLNAIQVTLGTEGMRQEL